MVVKQKNERIHYVKGTIVATEMMPHELKGGISGVLN